MNLNHLYDFPHLCAEGVSRAGVYQPCDKPAVAARLDDDGPRPYPVCVHHCRIGWMVPLAKLLGVDA